MSHITFWEEFVANDWEKYSKISSKITCFLCLIIGILSLILGNFLVSLWTLFCFVIVSIWEFPKLFIFISNFNDIKSLIEDKYQCRYDEMRACLYFIISLFCFYNSTICVIAGLSLLITSGLLLFSGINRKVDESDRLGNYQDITPPLQQSQIYHDNRNDPINSMNHGFYSIIPNISATINGFTSNANTTTEKTEYYVNQQSYQNIV